MKVFGNQCEAIEMKFELEKKEEEEINWSSKARLISDFYDALLLKNYGNF